MPHDWHRHDFPITLKRTYLNNAASTPMSLPGIRAVAAYLEDRAAMGAGANGKWDGVVARTRDKLARLVGGEPDDIALTGGTSHGLSLVAGGFDWREGDEAVIVVPDFTANVYPWLYLADRGVAVRMVERGADGSFTVDDVAARITGRTRLVAVTTVDFHTGFYADVAGIGNLCRERGLVFGVDAIQGLGVLPMDVASLGIDFLACGAHKWLLGVRGGGFLYIAPALRERVRPVLYGWSSVRNPGAYSVEHEIREDAGKYQPGAVPYMALAALDAGLDMLLGLGVERIRDRVLSLTGRILRGVADLGWPVVGARSERHRSGIVSFMPPGDPDGLHAFLAARNVDVSVRRGAVRVSPHFYNDGTDVDRLLEALGEWRG
ncbi:MAG: aminotransferase class V-fold PLP-dependent enzyme [Desulfovibrionaceae bacterium]|nr:aminotransferase class V-fold PLP-dependent enzyme [Desulfovibrionaceae bacterium]